MTTSSLLLALALWFSPAAEEAAGPGDTLGTHVVQPGENLWSITAHYLGDESLWRENWALNPGIEDPHRLRIGQELTVITERRIEASTAEIVRLSNDVEKNLQHTDWLPASPGDDLAARDGIRTLRDSSASLRFNDNTSLKLSEYSQIFLDTRETTLRNVDRGRIEVVQGSAELSFEPITRQRTEIELVAGPAVTRPEPTASGEARLRTVAAEEGGARVMVYSGFGSVAAGGENVRVGSGLGTAVPESGPPSPPERLLGSPRGLSPGDGATWAIANTPLDWRPVDGAATYLVEICRDADCQALVQRRAGLVDTTWQPRLSEAGEYFWRVSAVSASGLEGYPSRPVGFRLEQAIIDELGPRVAILPSGFRQDDGDGLLIGPATRLRLVARDDAIGVERIEYRWSEGDWVVWSDQPLSLPADADRAVLEARAMDRLGQWGPIARLEVEALP